MERQMACQACGQALGKTELSQANYNLKQSDNEYVRMFFACSRCKRLSVFDLPLDESPDWLQTAIAEKRQQDAEKAITIPVRWESEPPQPVPVKHAPPPISEDELLDFTKMLGDPNFRLPQLGEQP